MSATFETEKNRKAFLYTAIICGTLLLLAFLISWTHQHTPPSIVQELIEINLGNNAEGYGEEQPLVKGEKALIAENAEQPKTASIKTPAVEETKTDELSDKESAPVKTPVKTTVKVKEPAPVVPKPEPKPKVARATYPGGVKDGKGNGATEDNYKMGQGNNPNGKGDAGSPNGKPDSYGNTPGGKTGGSGLRVSKGDRQIVNNYIFMGDLPRATINAIIKVSPAGRGTFVTFDKGSTSADPKYANAIRGYLPNIEFNKSDHESIVTVPFNFREQ